MAEILISKIISGLAIHDAMDAVFEEFNVEIDQQAETAVGELQVAAELGFVKREDDLHDLVFDDDGVVDHDVHTERVVESDAVIHDRLPFLPDDVEASFGKLVAEAPLIHALDHSRPEVPMNDHRTADDPGRQLVLIRRGISEHEVGDV